MEEERKKELVKRFGVVTPLQKKSYLKARWDGESLKKSLGKYWQTLFYRIRQELTRGIRYSPQYTKRWKLEMEANVYNYVKHKRSLHEGNGENDGWDSGEWMRFLNRLNELHEMVRTKRFIDGVFNIIETKVLDDSLRLDILRAIARETDFKQLGRK